VDVALKGGSIHKRVRVFGDRHWERRVLGYAASAPKPFVTMPLVYERAFGGIDDTASDPKNHGAEMRNLVGVGFRLNSDHQVIHGSPLPNLEDPASLISSWSDKPRPMCFGPLGRGWRPRIQYAGTYDQKWLDERYPFLPFDFDIRYFQSAPGDQQLTSVSGGEEFECVNMTPNGSWKFRLPTEEFSVAFVYREYHVEVRPVLDTVLIMPDERQVVLTWRAGVAVRTKLHDLRQVIIGRPTAAQRRALDQGKRVFASLDAYVQWRRLNLLS
jgi:hypothetical protein